MTVIRTPCPYYVLVLSLLMMLHFKPYSQEKIKFSNFEKLFWPCDSALNLDNRNENLGRLHISWVEILTKMSEIELIFDLESHTHKIFLKFENFTFYGKKY